MKSYRVTFLAKSKLHVHGNQRLFGLNENLKTSHRMVIHNKSPILLNILNVFFQSNEKKNISNVPFWALTHTEFVF